MHQIKNEFRRVVVGSACVIIATLLMALPASAHVSIDPSEAPKESYGVFAFRVPNESDTANTVKVEVKFPEDYPIASVRTTSQDGWKSSVKTEKLDKAVTDHGEKIESYVSGVTWEGGSIEPGQYAEFHVSMGALPHDADSLTFKAIQTYSDGEVVSWIEETPASGEEPEHPAPVLTLTEATGDEHSSSSSETEAKAKDEESSNNSVAYVAVGIGVVALLVGLGAIAKKK